MHYDSYTENCDIKQLNGAVCILSLIPARQTHINMEVERIHNLLGLSFISVLEASNYFTYEESYSPFKYC